MSYNRHRTNIIHIEYNTFCEALLEPMNIFLSSLIYICLINRNSKSKCQEIETKLAAYLTVHWFD